MVNQINVLFVGHYMSYNSSNEYLFELLFQQCVYNLKIRQVDSVVEGILALFKIYKTFRLIRLKYNYA